MLNPTTIRFPSSKLFDIVIPLGTDNPSSQDKTDLAEDVVKLTPSGKQIVKSNVWIVASVLFIAI